jgi:putative ABC transport system ATP-binding protein
MIVPDVLSFGSQQIPYGLSLGQASAILMLMFTAGALANAGRSFLMRMSGTCLVLGTWPQVKSIAKA